MKKITNTSEDRLGNLMTVLDGEGGIERQEARGQEEFVSASKFLPTDSPDELFHYIIAQGGKIGSPVKDDPLFTEVTLPEGWKINPSLAHSMWSSLVDENGELIADIFYKAAFYDRKAYSRFMKGA